MLQADPETVSTILRVQNSSYVRIEGITFTSGEGWEEAGRTGVSLESCNNCRFTGNVIENLGGTLLLVRSAWQLTVSGNELANTATASAMYLGCSDASCWVQDSEISENWIHDVADQNDFGMYLGPGGQGNNIVDNVIHDIAGTGLLTHSTEFGDANTIERNAIFDVRQGFYIQGACRVRNNLVFDVDEEGIIFDDPDRGTFEDIVVTHNTVSRTGEWAAELNDWYDADDLVFANNALANPTGYGLYVDLVEDYADTAVPPVGMVLNNVVSGLVQGFDGVSDAVIYGEGFGDFEDAENNDFYPVTGSQLINTADASSGAWVPALDYNGVEREGDEPDVGAYEWFCDGCAGAGTAERYQSAAPGR